MYTVLQSMYDLMSNKYITEDECKKFNKRVVKIIRGKMEEIEALIDENKDCADMIKVLHLLRDPRGKFNSHMHLPGQPFRKNASGIKSVIDQVCSRIMQDIEIRKRLEIRYPKSFP